MKHAYKRLISMVLILLCLVPSARAYSKLQRNDSGPDVLNMQLALQYLGYTVNPDGKYGANTAATVKSFQREYGLKVDGIAGDKTLSLLYAMAPQYAPQIPSPGYAYPTAVPQQNTDSGVAVVTGGRLVLRAGPSAASTPVLEIPDGASVQVITRSGTWTSVLYNGMAGYVMTQYLAVGVSAPVMRPTTAPYGYFRACDPADGDRDDGDGGHAFRQPEPASGPGWVGAGDRLYPQRRCDHGDGPGGCVVRRAVQLYDGLCDDPVSCFRRCPARYYPDPCADLCPRGSAHPGTGVLLWGNRLGFHLRGQPELPGKRQRHRPGIIHHSQRIQAGDPFPGRCLVHGQV